MGKKFFFFLAFIALPAISGFGSQQKADSLKQVLKEFSGNGENFHDTTLIKTLNALAWQLQFNNPDTAITLSSRALKLAKKQDYKKGIGKSYHNLGSYYDLKGNYKQSLSHYYKSMEIWKTLFPPSGGPKGPATLGNIGVVYSNMGNYPKALEYYLKALRINEKFGNKRRKSTFLWNIGGIYYNQGDYPRALEYYLKALRIAEELNNKHGIAGLLGNIGVVYSNQEDYAKALEYYQKALSMAENLGDKKDISVWLGNIGIVYHYQGDYLKALEYYLKSLRIKKEIRNKRETAFTLGNMGELYTDVYEKSDVQRQSFVKHQLEASRMKDENPVSPLNFGTNRIGKLLLDSAIAFQERAFDIRKEIGDKEGITFSLNAIGDILVKQQKFTRALPLFRRAYHLSDSIGALPQKLESAEFLYNTWKKLGNADSALVWHEHYSAHKDSVFNKEKEKELGKQEVRYEFDKKLLAKEKELEKQQALADAKLKQQRLIIYSSAGGLAIVLFLAAFIFRERRKSERLLLNILPESTSKELKSKGKVKPRHYESVSVMFIDFKDFTKTAENLSPDELVAELDEIFRSFDRIIQKHGLEKIKTIGDAYMCAGGLPEENQTHAHDMVRAGLEIRQKTNDHPSWKARIGIHTGPVTAGVVGEKKFAYDIWGDTVNVASRMESSGEPGKVNVSEATYNQLTQQERSQKAFREPSFRFTSRGKVRAKNKGEMEMFFVDHKGA